MLESDGGHWSSTVPRRSQRSRGRELQEAPFSVRGFALSWLSAHLLPGRPMPRNPTTPWPTRQGSVFFAGVASPASLSRAVSAGRIRRLGTGIYTADLTSDPTELVDRNRWEIPCERHPRRDRGRSIGRQQRAAGRGHRLRHLERESAGCRPSRSQDLAALRAATARRRSTMVRRPADHLRRTNARGQPGGVARESRATCEDTESLRDRGLARSEGAPPSRGLAARSQGTRPRHRG